MPSFSRAGSSSEMITLEDDGHRWVTAEEPGTG